MYSYIYCIRHIVQYLLLLWRIIFEEAIRGAEAQGVIKRCKRLVVVVSLVLTPGKKKYLKLYFHFYAPMLRQSAALSSATPTTLGKPPENGESGERTQTTVE